ncbi:Membrane protein involved in the export of O-antigen and teichoic acid [Marinobacter sp. DSM 26671]|uniref:oligosaccharide flippase family protein n=1 Tax=Marinobacter sp. DSM 26671 TaxID=1761793 RepID=UPI0008ECB2DF|nr:oligosaccharide flippase family protein [Marinobacter sp. DSM 26671]SFD90540.1 Membrane protein involved in the export of O-antigen and teichoic acid [Marinobacter sp. DSM 26671]
MSTSSRVFKSSTFLLAIQLFQRSLGLISTLILARLLVPEDFGIVAMVAIALQFFETLADAGNKHYIIQKSEVTDQDLNTAWTMNLAIKTVMATLIIVVAPLISEYLGAPELTMALSIAALAMPLGALRNPILMLMARELNYRPVFVLSIWQKAVSFIVVVVFALIHPSYWAIIAGDLVAAIVMAIGSYFIHAYKPALTLQKIGAQWHFSKWLILRGVVGFTRSQIDNLIVSKLFGTGQLGGYHLIRELATFPALSVIIPGSEPLQAAIAERKNHSEQLAYRIRLSLFMMVTLLTPLTIFMAAYSEQIVNVFLGPQWGDFEELLRPFALFFFTFCLFALVSDAFVATGQVRALFIFDLVSTTIIVGFLLSLEDITLSTMAWARGWLAVLTTLALLLILQSRTHFNLARLGAISVLVLAPSLFAWLVTEIVRLSFFPATALISLILSGLLFSGLVTILLMAIAASSRPHIDEIAHLWDQGTTILKTLYERIHR